MNSGVGGGSTATTRQALPALLLLLGAVLIAYRETAASMVAIWSRSDTFAHAFLVPPIVLWLIWRKRHELALLKPQPCPWIFLPMAGFALTWLLGDLASVNSVAQLSMTALLVLSVPAVLGLPITNVILFPLTFLFFAVPIGDFLLTPMMSWTADFTVLALRASGIPVMREGIHLVIPSGTWAVVEACSGVRFLIASFMVGTLYAYLNYRSARRRWIFVGISIAVPIVANWIRAYLIVLIGHLSSNTLAVGVDHLVYGWIFFGLVIGLLYAIGTLWAEPPRAPLEHNSELQATLRARPRRAKHVWTLAFVGSVLIVAPHIALNAIGDVHPGRAPQLTSLRLSGGWQLSSKGVFWKPAFENPSAELNETYAADGREVAVYIGYYRNQNYERKLVSSNNGLVKSNDPVWLQLGRLGADTLERDGKTTTFRSALLRSTAARGRPEQRVRVWQVYWVGGTLTSSDHWAKVHSAIDRLLGRGDDAAVIVLCAVEDERGGARVLLESFARTNLSAIVTHLIEAREVVRASVALSDHRL
jgi:exosortase A